MDRLRNMDWSKVVKGALIASAGCALTYLSQWASGSDFGALAPIVTAVLAVVVNFVRKLESAGHDAEED